MKKNIIIIIILLTIMIVMSILYNQKEQYTSIEEYAGTFNEETVKYIEDKGFYVIVAYNNGKLVKNETVYLDKEKVLISAIKKVYSE